MVKTLTDSAFFIPEKTLTAGEVGNRQTKKFKFFKEEHYYGKDDFSAASAYER